MCLGWEGEVQNLYFSWPPGGAWAMRAGWITALKTLTCILFFSFHDRGCSRLNSSSRLQRWSDSCNSNFQVRQNFFPPTIYSCFCLCLLLTKIINLSDSFQIHNQDRAPIHITDCACSSGRLSSADEWVQPCVGCAEWVGGVGRAGGVGGCSRHKGPPTSSTEAPIRENLLTSVV